MLLQGVTISLGQRDPLHLHETVIPAFTQYRKLRMICLNLQFARVVCCESAQAAAAGEVVPRMTRYQEMETEKALPKSLPVNG
jgi:hypothetical protein